MVAYAVGEMTRQLPTTGDSEENINENENQQPSSSSSNGSNVTKSIIRRHSSTVTRYRRPVPASCYEVVTAWVHPR